jgi:tocopherol O-methyltransferase
MPAISEAVELDTGNPGVGAYYDERTQRIIDRYGPGPRVHYHVGIFSNVDTNTTAPREVIHQRIRAAQERLLDWAGGVWDAESVFAGKVLDLGCGLGGGSLYWAEHFGASVTAITNIPEHVPIIERFAADVGVASLVRPLLANAGFLPALGGFDAAVAFESMCHMPRDGVFRGLATALRPGGSVCIEDVFLGNERWRDPFDTYWHTRVGSVADYVGDAELAGFALEDDVDFTEESTEFWVQTLALLEIDVAACTPEEGEYQRLMQSIRWHASFLRAWRDRGIETRLLRFRLPE